MGMAAAAGLISLIVLGSLVWYLRRRVLRWAAEARDVGVPLVHVVVHPAADTEQSFDVTLHDTTRPYRIERISIDVDDLVRTGLETPAGFARSEALENE